MTKTFAETRFEKARKKLSDSLRNLEDVIKNKLHETAIQTKMIDVSEHDLANSQAMIVEQTNTIQNLSHEINNLQKNLSDLGKENEFINEKNRVLGERLNNLRELQTSVLTEVEDELSRIESLIKSEEE